MLADFDPGTMPHDSMAMIVGVRRAGKTRLARHLAAGRDVLAVMHAVREDGPAWRALVGEGTPVVDRYDQYVLEDCLRRPRGCVVTDDCAVDRRFNDALVDLAAHAGLGSINTVQYCLDIKPTLRAVRYWFAFRHPSPSFRAKLFGRACAGWVGEGDFDRAFADATAAPNRALVVDTVQQRLWQYTVPVPDGAQEAGCPDGE